MATIYEDPTGAENELSCHLRSYKGQLSLNIGGAVVNPQVDKPHALLQATRWAKKCAEKYAQETGVDSSQVGELELRGPGVGTHAAAIKARFPKASLRVVDPHPVITKRVLGALGALGTPYTECTFDQTPWQQTASTQRMVRTVPNSITIANLNYANIAMYDSANGESAVRALKGDQLLTNPPEKRVYSLRTMKLLQAIASGAPVGLANDLANVYGGRPFVVVAPGSGFDAAEVKRLQEGGAVILALWQSLERLNAAGVVPNLAVCLDPSYLLIEKYKGGKAQALLCDTMAVQDFWQMGMPVYLFNVRSAHLHQNLWQSMDWFTLADQSQTVSEASVWIALMLGASSILVMGADYANKVKGNGNVIPCAGNWYTQWHYWGACKHMLQLGMALTHGKAGQLTNGPQGQPGIFFVAEGLFSHIAKLWGLVLPIFPNAKDLGVTEGSVAPVAPTPTPIAKAYPKAAEVAKELLRVAATTTPQAMADKSVLSKTLHADFATASQADRELMLRACQLAP